MVKAPKVRGLTIRFSEDEAKFLEEQSELEDVSAATVVRKALREYIDRLRATASKKSKR